MRRTERLFTIIQVLRARRRPVTARELADELEVSLRTIYRDTAELIAQRVPLRGEAGTGYMIAYMEEVRVLAAHCELRGGFRHFRTDRIREARVLDARYPESQRSLRRRWELEHPRRSSVRPG